MQRKLPSDVFANVSRGHLPLDASAHSSVSLLLTITAMDQPGQRRNTRAKNDDYDRRPRRFTVKILRQPDGEQLSLNLPPNETFEQGSAWSETKW